MITLALYLSPRRLEQIDAAISKMRAAIAAGIVPNKGSSPRDQWVAL